jgi:hypothetical protein
MMVPPAPTPPCLPPASCSRHSLTRSVALCLCTRRRLCMRMDGASHGAGNMNTTGATGAMHDSYDRRGSSAPGPPEYPRSTRSTPRVPRSTRRVPAMTGGDRQRRVHPEGIEGGVQALHGPRAPPRRLPRMRACARVRARVRVVCCMARVRLCAVGDSRRAAARADRARARRHHVLRPAPRARGRPHARRDLAGGASASHPSGPAQAPGHVDARTARMHRPSATQRGPPAGFLGPWRAF